MSKLLQGFGVIGTVAAATFCSGFAALIGAQVGGLQEGGWNFQFLPPLFYGWFGGFVVALVCLAIASSRKAAVSNLLVVTFIVPLLITFSVSAAAYSLQRPASFKPVYQKIKSDPAALRTLIADAKIRPLSQAEQRALWYVTSTKNSIPADDVGFLLEYFASNPVALAGIMTYQAITPEQLRYLYERHKHPKEYSRVLDELVKHPLTPPDVLQSLTEESDKYLVAKARERISKVTDLKQK